MPARRRAIAFSEGHFSTRVASPHTSKNIGSDFSAAQWDWAMEKSLLAAYTPPLRNKVRKPAGFPTPFRWAYPVLAGAVDWSGRRASAVRRVSTANLEVERFVEKAKWLFRKISRPEHRSSLKSWFGAETGEGLCPSPCPHPSQEGCGPPDTYRGVSEGERSEPGGRAAIYEGSQGERCGGESER